MCKLLRCRSRCAGYIKDVEVAIWRVHHIEFLLIGRQRDAVAWRTRGSSRIPGESMNRHCVEYLTGADVTDLEAKESSGGSISEGFHALNSEWTDTPPNTTHPPRRRFS